MFKIFNNKGVSDGFGLACFLGGLSLLAIICFNQSFFHTSVVGLNCRGAVIALIFEKALRLSSSAKGTFFGTITMG